MLIYANNDVDISIEYANTDERKVNVNDKNLIWISKNDAENFQKELCELLDKYRI